jgi:hypothetical protein
MTTIFSINPDDMDDSAVKMDIDELYGTRMKRSKEEFALYNNVLKKIHTKIRNTSRTSKDQHTWYLVPEVIIGIHYYNEMECVKFIMNQLLSNGFKATYTHPNLIFVCWNNWVPDYVRRELAKKTGVQIDNKGDEIKTIKRSPFEDKNAVKKQSIFKDIGTYIPSGKFI